MPKSDGPSEEVLRSLDERAAALERRAARPTGSTGVEGQAIDQAYRLIVELVGGVLVGLGLGFGVQWLHLVPAPWGLIGGVLLGFAVSVWMAKRTADRLMARAAAYTARTGPATSVPAVHPGESRGDDEDD